MLDLFCGSGGASVGYARAGWEVVGVDLAPQPHYPFEFHRADALTFPLDGFDLVHASPPCQGYSPHVSSADSPHAGTRGKLEPRLIDAIRDRLLAARVPYVIENVYGARGHLWFPYLLCGTMFDLPVPRHRVFESPVPFLAPAHPDCRGVAARYADARGWDRRDMTVTGKGRKAGTLDRWREVMGWPEYRGTQHGMREAIPPAYTEWIGRHLMVELERAA